MTNQTIDGVPRERVEKMFTQLRTVEGRSELREELRALLDSAPAGWRPCSPELLESGVDCATAPRWSSKEWDGHAHWHPAPAAQPQGEPVALTAVGVLRDDGDGGLEPEWILEGGTAELWAGAVLLVADEDQELCAEDGHCELYRAPSEQPAPVDMVLVAEAWEACGGNPGIKADRAELLTALRLMNESEDEQPAPVTPDDAKLREALIRECQNMQNVTPGSPLYERVIAGNIADQSTDGFTPIKKD